MARPNRYSWSEKKIDSFLRQGRGSGIGREYRPWLNVTDVPSVGVSSQPYFDRIGRRLQLLSDLESAVFLRFWRDPRVVDIREQFPLPRLDTREIAASIGVDHPKYPRTSIDTVMTTDMLLLYEENGIAELQAFAIKTAHDASQPRSKEKLEIERIYWENVGIPWRVVTEEELPAIETLNLSWIFGADRSLVGSGSSVPGVLRNIELAFLRTPLSRAASTCLSMDDKFCCEPGSHLAILRAAISAWFVFVEVRHTFIAQAPCEAFSFNVHGDWTCSGLLNAK